MSKITEIFNYMRTCPALSNLWSISGQEVDGNKVIIPQGSSPATTINERIDVLGCYEAEIKALPSVYEDFQINCFAKIDPRDEAEPEENINVLSYDEVRNICDWVIQQDEEGNLPQLTGEKVISVETFPFVPQIRFVDNENGIIGYFITVRVRYVNRRKSRFVDYGGND